MSNYVKRYRQDQLETIEFFTEQSNSLPSDILSQLVDTIDDISTTSDCPIILLKVAVKRYFAQGLVLMNYPLSKIWIQAKLFLWALPM